MKLPKFLIGLALLAGITVSNAQPYEHFIPIDSIPLEIGSSNECIGAYDAKSVGQLTNAYTQSVWFRAPVGGQVVLEDTTPAPYTGKFKVIQRSNGSEVACGASPLTWHAGPLSEYKIDFYIPEGYTVSGTNTNGVRLSFQRPVYDYFVRWDTLPITESYSSNECGSYEGYVNITNPATGSIWWDIPESGYIWAWDTSPSSYAANLKFIRSDFLESCANKTNSIRGRWDRRVKLIAFLPELYATTGNTNGIGIRFPRTQIVGAEFTEFLSTSPSQAWFEIEAPDTNMVYSLFYSQQIGGSANWINHTNFRGSFALTNINVVAHMSTNRPHGFWRVVGTTNTPPEVGANVGTEDGLDTPIGFPPQLPGCTNDCGSIDPTPPTP